MRRSNFLTFLSIAGLLPCLSTLAQSDTAYVREIERWHEQRLYELKEPNGWLNLVGLYWLEEGRSSFGSAAGNRFVFPAGSIDSQAGFFERVGGTVKMVVADQVAIAKDGQPVKEAVIFSKDSLHQPTLASGSLRWNVIQREDRIGIRLRDLNSPEQRAFTDIDRFSIDKAWRVSAVFQPAPEPRSIAITNVIGQTSQQRTPGKLIFSIGNVTYTLDALAEGDELFIIFADATNGKTTYPSGRFLGVERPAGPGNHTVIDFNKAYDPPCAFTKYATCPLPPRQNVLPLEVNAGEKDFGHNEAK
jgi:uncharacterized protein